MSSQRPEQTRGNPVERPRDGRRAEPAPARRPRRVPRPRRRVRPRTRSHRAETITGRVVVGVVFGGGLALILVGWLRLLLHPDLLEVSDEEIRYAMASGTRDPGHRSPRRRCPLRFLARSAGRVSFPAFSQPGSGTLLTLHLFSRKPVQAACEAHGWRIVRDPPGSSPRLGLGNDIRDADLDPVRVERDVSRDLGDRGVRLLVRPHRIRDLAIARQDRVVGRIALVGAVRRVSVLVSMAESTSAMGMYCTGGYDASCRVRRVCRVGDHLLAGPDHHPPSSRLDRDRVVGTWYESASGHPSTPVGVATFVRPRLRRRWRTTSGHTDDPF